MRSKEDLKKLFPCRCVLWRRVYWDGWGCLDAGQRLAGKPLQSRFQRDSTIKSPLLNDPFLLQGSSVHIWNDQWTPPRPLPVRHAVPHDKFNSGWKNTHINIVLFFFFTCHNSDSPRSSVTVAVFTLQGGLTGMIVGLVLTLWVGIGGQIYPPLAEKTRPLSLTTINCSSNFNTTESPLTTLLMTPLTTPEYQTEWVLKSDDMIALKH